MRGMALLIHGDAGFAGEGIVQEMFNLSQLDAYAVGGTLHVIINNQIGFTTPPEEGRSSAYATDVAKMLDIPIFHVNGDDPEAIAWVIQLAMEFRKTFHRDVVIDMYGYRRWGHNEGDEPTFTQPVLYHAIKRHKTVREYYLQQLLGEKCVTHEEAENVRSQYRAMLDRELEAARGETPLDGAAPFRGIWEDYRGGLESEADEPATGVKEERLSTPAGGANSTSGGVSAPSKDREGDRGKAGNGQWKTTTGLVRGRSFGFRQRSHRRYPGSFERAG
jgi:2-oxoglutarate dehydrogenase E1 component